MIKSSKYCMFGKSITETKEQARLLSGLILSVKNLSPFTFSRKCTATRIIRGVGGVTSDRHHTGRVSFADAAPYRKFGFTLAEVLITLGIIGVVVALTMPTLIANYQKHVALNKLKQTYSILYQAIELSENDNGYISEWVMPVNNQESLTKFCNTYLLPYLKYSSYKNPKIKLANGVSLILWTSAGSEQIQMSVYLKDFEHQNSGKNYFNFWLGVPPEYAVIKQKLRPYDNNGVIYNPANPLAYWRDNNVYGCNKNNNNRAFCTGYIMYNNWQIPKDYPW